MMKRQRYLRPLLFKAIPKRKFILPIQLIHDIVGIFFIPWLLSDNYRRRYNGYERVLFISVML